MTKALVKMRVNPDITEDMKDGATGHRTPSRKMIQLRGKILNVEPNKHNYEWVSWDSDNTKAHPHESYGWYSPWLIPVNDLHKAVEL